MIDQQYKRTLQNLMKISVSSLHCWLLTRYSYPVSETDILVWHDLQTTRWSPTQVQVCSVCAPVSKSSSAILVHQTSWYPLAVPSTTSSESSEVSSFQRILEKTCQSQSDWLLGIKIEIRGFLSPLTITLLPSILLPDNSTQVMVVCWKQPVEGIKS